MITETLILVFSYIVLIFWIAKQIKTDFFWLYLWQLKNYHIGRFNAHFDTDAGRKIFGISFFVKAFFCLISLSFILCSFLYGFSYDNIEFLSNTIYIFISASVVLMIIEGMHSLKSLFLEQSKKPEQTKKMIFLEAITFLVLLVFLIFIFQQFLLTRAIGLTNALHLVFLLFSFDLLSMVIISSIVLFFQPLTVYLRNKTLSKARSKINSLKNLLVIGITGSYGKSSTKEFLKIILSESFSVVSTVKNQNSEIGISECILRDVSSDHEIFICEMGAYNKGGIKLLCSIAQPKIGILTGIGNQHLATFGSQENIIKTKLELIDNLPSEGVAVLNWDSEFVKDNFKDRKISTLKCSTEIHEDMWAEGVKNSDSGLIFDACFKNGERIKIKTGIIGNHHLSNLLLCIAVAKKLGMSSEEIANGCEKITAKISGMEIEQTKHGFSAINSSYSANRVGVLSHLDHFKDIITTGKKILVMPCIIELGRDAKKTHYEIGKKIAKSCDVAIITTSDYFEDIKKGAQSECMKDYNIICIENPNKAFDIIKQRIDGGVVLLEGRSSKNLVNKIFEK
ncbi:UDP-N-acetylmuramoyl-tripeptide--D-alanyl-D-alanine ligase [bacterium]|nr:UDP-N-acetylmuramoyl-tripeptide--D-alanyl-D-alanine ligase [bacterium]